MISVGILGGPLLGTLQDVSLDQNLRQVNPGLHVAIAEPEQQKFGFHFHLLSKAKIESLSSDDKGRVEKVIAQTNQAVLAKIAILPLTMFAFFLVLGIFFMRRGGYRQIELVRSR